MAYLYCTRANATFAFYASAASMHRAMPHETRWETAKSSAFIVDDENDTTFSIVSRHPFSEIVCVKQIHASVDQSYYGVTLAVDVTVSIPLGWKVLDDAPLPCRFRRSKIRYDVLHWWQTFVKAVAVSRCQSRAIFSQAFMWRSQRFRAQCTQMAINRWHCIGPSLYASLSSQLSAPTCAWVVQQIVAVLRNTNFATSSHKKVG